MPSIFGAYLTYVQLCFFQSSVRKASGSTGNLLLVCTLFALTSSLLFQLAPDGTDPVNFFGRTLVVFSVFNVLMYVSLFFKNVHDRYRKVLSTFVGTRILIDLVMIIVLLVVPEEEYIRDVIVAIVAIWRMCIVGYILSEGLGVRLPTAILISVLFTFISIGVADLSFGIQVAPEEVPTSE